MEGALPADFRFVDLCAGIGGFRLAAEARGGRCVLTCEHNKFSRQTYEANFRDTEDHVFVEDVFALGADPSSVPDHDLLCAGFPCQPFSSIGLGTRQWLGMESGLRDETQGTIFYELAKIIDAKRPAAFLLENVPHLVSHDDNKTFATIMRTLEWELGYEVSAALVSSEAWVPQLRKRTFIAGFRDHVNFDLPSALEYPPPPLPRLGSIYDDPAIAAKFILTEKMWNWMRHRKKVKGFPVKVFGPDDTSCATLVANYAGEKFPLIEYEPFPRRLTLRECARYMGFPESFRIVCSKSQTYRQFGNAVVPPVVRAIIAAMQNCPSADQQRFDFVSGRTA